MSRMDEDSTGMMAPMRARMNAPRPCHAQARRPVACLSGVSSAAGERHRRVSRSTGFGSKASGDSVVPAVHGVRRWLLDERCDAPFSRTFRSVGWRPWRRDRFRDAEVIGGIADRGHRAVRQRGDRGEARRPLPGERPTSVGEYRARGRLPIGTRGRRARERCVVVRDPGRRRR